MPALPTVSVSARVSQKVTLRSGRNVGNGSRYGNTSESGPQLVPFRAPLITLWQGNMRVSQLLTIPIFN